MPYFGGKTRLAGQIAALLPAHEHYIEPFAGSLAVLLAKQPSQMETVNDLDGHLMTFWRVLRDRREELERVCALTPHGRGEHEAAVALDADDDLELSRQVWVVLTQGRAGKVRRKSWRHYVDPAGSKTSMPEYLDGYVDRMAAAMERLHGVTLECRPALEMIERYGRYPNVLLYVDPPYLGATRGHDQVYRHEMREEKDHRELAAALHGCRASVVLSGYASPLYDLELYPGWDRHTMATSTGQGGGWSSRTEVLWSNRPLDLRPTLFDLPAQEGGA
jgi:DNA adenine methylase